MIVKFKYKSQVWRWWLSLGGKPDGDDLKEFLANADPILQIERTETSKQLTLNIQRTGWKHALILRFHALGNGHYTCFGIAGY